MIDPNIITDTEILEFHSKVWDTRQNLKDKFLKVLDYAEYLKKELIRIQDSA